METNKQPNNSSLPNYLKILTLVTLVLMLYPLLTHPLLTHVVYGDVTGHYAFAYLLSHDITQIKSTTYPGLYALTSAVIHNLTGLSLGASMYLLIVIAAVLLPIMTYKLTLALTKQKDISLLSAFLSVAVTINMTMVGLSAPVAQTIALTLLPLTLYLFVSGRPAAAGVALGVYIITHFSWPLTFFLLFLYSALVFMENRKYAIFKKLAITIVIAIIVASPYYLYVFTQALYDMKSPTISTVKPSFKGISVVSFLWLIWPPFIILLALYASWKIYREKKEWNTSYKFIIISFLIILLSTQEYFLNIFVQEYLFGGDILKTHAIFEPNRVLVFVLYFVSVLSAYSIYKITSGREKPILLICLAIIALAVPEYYQTYDNFTLTDTELSMIEFFHSTGNYSERVVYDITDKKAQAETYVINMGGKVVVQSEDNLLFFDQFKTINCPQIGYILASRNDTAMNAFIEKHKTSFSEIYSNRDYLIYGLLEQPECLNNSVDGYVDAFTYYYDAYIFPAHMSGFAKMTPFVVMLESKDTKKDICLSISTRMEKVDCDSSRRDFKISGSDMALKYLFSHPYGVKPFTDNLLWLYDNGFIEISAGSNVDINIIVPNKLSKIVKTVNIPVYFYDIGVYAKARVNESEIDLHITTKPVGNYFKLSLGFFAKIIEWTNLARSYSYPNILIGLPYAIGSEISGQLLHPGGA